ncbi:hypothetical protein EWM64_g5275, partial [Hericium alpestre]
MHPSNERRHRVGHAAPHVLGSVAARLDEFEELSVRRKRQKLQQEQDSDDLMEEKSSSSDRGHEQSGSIDAIHSFEEGGHDPTSAVDDISAAESDETGNSDLSTTIRMPCEQDNGGSLAHDIEAGGQQHNPSLLQAPQATEDYAEYEYNDCSLDDGIREPFVHLDHTVMDSDDSDDSDNDQFDDSMESDDEVEMSYGDLEPDDPFLSTFDFMDDDFLRKTQLDAEDVTASDLATEMQYRAFQHQPEPDTIKDVFDSKRYKQLCRENVVVDGTELPHKFFADPRDIALGLSTDGFAPFRRRKKTCWPLILFNYNLPPETRFHIANIISLGVIPGPKKPIDSDSFLWPFVQEALELA